MFNNYVIKIEEKFIFWKSIEQNLIQGKTRKRKKNNSRSQYENNRTENKKLLLIKKGEKKQQIFDINSYTMSQLGTVYATKRRRRNGKR